MNKKRLTHLAKRIESCEHLEGPPVIYYDRPVFNMGHWAASIYPDGVDAGPACQTACCIGGHVLAMKSHETGTPFSKLYRNESIVDAVCDWADISYEQAKELCLPGSINPQAEAYEEEGGADITPAQAAACIRHLRDEGVVDWPYACNKKENLL